MSTESKYFPSRKEFLKLAKKGNLIPVYTEIPAGHETPLSAFAKIDDGDFSYLLESVVGGERIARYSFLGSRPALTFMSKGGKITVRKGIRKKVFTAAKGPLDEIKKIMKKFSFVPVRGLPRFCGGLVGYMGYDTVRFFERIPDNTRDDLNLPDCFFMLTDTILLFDHVERRIKIVSNAFVAGDPSSVYEASLAKIRKIKSGLLRPAKTPLPREKTGKRAVKNTPVKSNLTKRQFTRIVKKAKKYIRRGDIIQVVLSQRFKKSIKADPFEVYRALRKINPSPYMFYLKFGALRLVGASPEIMVRCEESVAEVRPIAGTRPRGLSKKEDNLLARELLKDPKELSEHIMLVDLGRNDIGRVCRYDSVKVSEFMTIEKYSHVMHLVSDVSGVLDPANDIFALVRASFPAGTVTGAPKIRAMEIIDELEKVKRGVYAGSVGYFSFSGNLDTCIAIRTIVVNGKNAYIQAGAGIVADSVPEREYKETLNKAKAMFKAIEKSEREGIFHGPANR